MVGTHPQGLATIGDANSQYDILSEYVDRQFSATAIQSPHLKTQLTEQHSVDDQVEWVDNATILYGLPGAEGHAAQTNVWALPTDGQGQPRLLIENAWSPAVVR